MPESWLPPKLSESSLMGEAGAWNKCEQDETLCYPACTYNFQVIADHHPALLTIEGGSEETQQAARRLKLDQMTTESWAEPEKMMKEYLDGKKDVIQTSCEQQAPTRMPTVITEGIHKSLHDHYCTPKTGQPDPDPFQQFCQRHLDDPDYPALIRSHVEGNDLLKGRLMREISRRGWRNYLSHTQPSDARAIFAYLAIQEGRKPRASAFSCADPLEDAEGILRFTGQEKCSLLADHFGRRFSDPNLTTTEQLNKRQATRTGLTNKSHAVGVINTARASKTNTPVNRPRSLYNKPIQGTFQQFSQAEIAKAMESLATKKAPGPKGWLRKFPATCQV